MNIAAASQDFKRYKISNIFFVRYGENIEDGPNKWISKEKTCTMLVQESSSGLQEMDNMRKFSLHKMLLSFNQEIDKLLPFFFFEVYI